MTLLVGLGNPGEKYKYNRHNAGFIIVDELAHKWGLTWEFNKKLNVEQANGNCGVLLIKPQTFMNDSGEAVLKTLNYFNIQCTDLLVIHDDVDLEPLQFKVSRNSSSAGHHGVQNIIDKIGTQDFIRLRIGIGRPLLAKDLTEAEVAKTAYDVEKYVLQDFPSDQLDIVRKTGIEHLLSSLSL